LETHSFYSLDEFFDKQWYFFVHITLSTHLVVFIDTQTL
jgi:hypothetical protein